jgi:hypothetical protein
VPGNHDFYADHGAFERALRGPLQAYAKTSTLGVPVELAGAVVVPVTTAMAHRLWFSAGTLTVDMARTLDALARDPALSDRPLLVVQHHPPLGHGKALWNWIDGTRAPERGARLLRDHAHMHVLHGHTHARRSYRARREGPEQCHSGAAVLSSSEHVRFYDTAHGELHALDATGSAPVAGRLVLS